MPKTVTRQKAIARLAGRLHFHPCTQCGLSYSCSCGTPAVNGRCHGCRHPERTRLVWDQSRDPRPCCVDNCRQLMTGEELLRYQLAGPGPWFQCRTCARAHSKPPTTQPLPTRKESQ